MLRALAFAALCASATAGTAQVAYPPVTDLSALATKADMAAVQAAIPTPSATLPPAVTDTGSIGTMSGMYALANHTHASKARKDRVLIPATGALDVTFTNSFSVGVSPLCAVVAETTLGDTNVVNAQIDGRPVNTGLRIRITRTATTVNALLGLTILFVPTQTATYAHYICLEP